MEPHHLAPPPQTKSGEPVKIAVSLLVGLRPPRECDVIESCDIGVPQVPLKVRPRAPPGLNPPAPACAAGCWPGMYIGDEATLEATPDEFNSPGGCNDPFCDFFLHQQPPIQDHSLLPACVGSTECSVCRHCGSPADSSFGESTEEGSLLTDQEDEAVTTDEGEQLCKVNGSLVAHQAEGDASTDDGDEFCKGEELSEVFDVPNDTSTVGLASASMDIIALLRAPTGLEADLSSSTDDILVMEIEAREGVESSAGEWNENTFGTGAGVPLPAPVSPTASHGSPRARASRRRVERRCANIAACSESTPEQVATHANRKLVSVWKGGCGETACADTGVSTRGEYRTWWFSLMQLVLVATIVLMCLWCFSTPGPLKVGKPAVPAANYHGWAAIAPLEAHAEVGDKSIGAVLHNMKVETARAHAVAKHLKAVLLREKARWLTAKKQIKRMQEQHRLWHEQQSWFQKPHADLHAVNHARTYTRATHER